MSEKSHKTMYSNKLTPIRQGWYGACHGKGRRKEDPHDLTTSNRPVAFHQPFTQQGDIMVRTSFLFVLIATLIIAGTGFAAEDSGGVVNINTADAEQLQLLPRVGPALADRIITFRTDNGTFSSPDELVAVKGIGEKSLENLRPYLAVEGETTLTTKVSIPRKAAS
jgi:competence protein ComEA